MPGTSSKHCSLPLKTPISSIDIHSGEEEIKHSNTYDGDNENLIRTIMDLKLELAEAKATIDTLRHQHRRITTDNWTPNRIKELKLEVSETRTQIDDLKHENFAIRCEKTNLEREIKSVSEIVASYHHRTNRLSKHLDQVTKQRDDAIKKLQDLSLFYAIDLNGETKAQGSSVGQFTEEQIDIKTIMRRNTLTHTGARRHLNDKREGPNLLLTLVGESFRNSMPDLGTGRGNKKDDAASNGNGSWAASSMFNIFRKNSKSSEQDDSCNQRTSQTSGSTLRASQESIDAASFDRARKFFGSTKSRNYDGAGAGIDRLIDDVWDDDSSETGSSRESALFHYAKGKGADGPTASRSKRPLLEVSSIQKNTFNACEA